MLSPTALQAVPSSPMEEVDSNSTLNSNNQEHAHHFSNGRQLTTSPLFVRPQQGAPLVQTHARAASTSSGSTSGGNSERVLLFKEPPKGASPSHASLSKAKSTGFFGGQDEDGLLSFPTLSLSVSLHSSLSLSISLPLLIS